MCLYKQFNRNDLINKNDGSDSDFVKLHLNTSDSQLHQYNRKRYKKTTLLMTVPI